MSTPRTVKNRDIPVLARMLYVMQDVSVTEELRKMLQERLYNMSARITGSPGGNGEPKGLDAPFAAIGEMEERYGQECDSMAAELLHGDTILNSIPSETMRAFVKMRYVMGMSRGQIMTKLGLKKWEYFEICDRIEQAENMAHVCWQEKYALKP